MTLWFEDAWENERVISEQCNSMSQVYAEIGHFIDQCNATKPEHPFKWYYTRTWRQADGRWRIDVGSHSEFFLWDGEHQ